MKRRNDYATHPPPHFTTTHQASCSQTCGAQQDHGQDLQDGGLYQQTASPCACLCLRGWQPFRTKNAANFVLIFYGDPAEVNRTKISHPCATLKTFNLVFVLFFTSLLSRGKNTTFQKEGCSRIKIPAGWTAHNRSSRCGRADGRVLHASCALSCLSMSALSLIAGKGCRPSGCCVQSLRHSSPGKFLPAHTVCQGGEDDHTADACQQHDCVNRKPSLLS